MLAGFKNFDPAVEKKLACHPDLPAYACEWGHRKGTSTFQQAVGDLIVIAFYFLLRIGEYTTKTRRRSRTRTRQFRVMDVTFFVQDDTGQLIALAVDAPAEDIMRAEAATLRISNQKNGHAGACVHHTALKGAGLACPVRALGRRVKHVRSHTKSGKAFLCSYWDEIGRGDVTDDNVRFAVKAAAASLKYPDRGIPLERVGTHLLRSGGACALKIAGYEDLVIQKMGRWKANSRAFLEYIQQQLSSFSAGMSEAMSRVPVFTNMEGAVVAEDLRDATVF